MCESFGTGTTQVIGNVKHPCSVCLKGVGVNSIRCTQCVQWELPWPSGYELRLSLERSRVLILVKVIGGRQEGHPVQKCSLLQQSPN